MLRKMYQSAKIYEAELNEIRNDIIEEIAKRLAKVELPNVKRVSSAPLVVIVSSSVVFSNSWNLSAEYYISEEQTKQIMKKINNCKTISDIKRTIIEIIQKGYIEIHSKFKVFINSAVKETLIEIETMLM